MDKKINVLSLFDGISCGRIALERANINVGKYYASEIDKYATQISEHNYPDIIRLGDVTKWKEWDIDWSIIDLLIAGFPCQAWSVAGKQKGDTDPRGALVHELIAIWSECKKHNHNVKFLFENVKMKKEFILYINDLFGVEPIEINSALVSAQNRRRLYWTNIEGIEQPEDKGILLKDIIESGFSDRDKSLVVTTRVAGATEKRYKEKSMHQMIVDRDKSHCIDANYYKGGNLKSYFEKHRRQLVFELKQINDRVEGVTIDDDGIRPHRGDARKSGIYELGRINFEDAEKTYCVTSNHSPKVLTVNFKANNGKNVVINENEIDTPKTVYETRTELGKKSRREHRNLTGKDSTKRSKDHKEYRVQKHEKANCLVTVDSELNNIIDHQYSYRKLTPLECERLQTLPDSYTLVLDKNGKQKVSNSQRYKSIGNGWTVDVIAHIFKNLKF